MLLMAHTNSRKGVNKGPQEEWSEHDVKLFEDCMSDVSLNARFIIRLMFMRRKHQLSSSCTVCCLNETSTLKNMTTNPVHVPHMKRVRYFTAVYSELYPGTRDLGPRRGVFTIMRWLEVWKKLRSVWV